MTDKIVTIVGSSYFEPISVLLEELEKRDIGKTRKGFQAGYYINGFASSVCLLSVVCLESYVMRVRNINKATQDDVDRTPVPIYLKKLYPKFPFEIELNEIHVVRDVLAHNHLWEVSYSSTDEGLIHHSSEKRSSGDKKYQQYVTGFGDSTTTLGLNVSPINIGRSDAKKVIQTVWRILLYLEGKNRNQCYVSHLQVMHKGKNVKFGKVIGLPETCT